MMFRRVAFRPVPSCFASLLAGGTRSLSRGGVGWCFFLFIFLFYSLFFLGQLLRLVFFFLVLPVRFASSCDIGEYPIVCIDYRFWCTGLCFDCMSGLFLFGCSLFWFS